MVNPETPRDFDGCAFARGLEDCRTIYYSGSFRYEFFFLPGATAGECVAHYRGELAARGTLWHQVREVTQTWNKKHAASEEAVDDPAEALSPGDDDEPHFGVTSEQGLPGFPWVKRPSDWYFTNYRNWLFMYLDADIQWGPDQDHNVCVVQFDPMPIEGEEGARVRWDPMEHPIHLSHMKVRSRVDDEALYLWMSDKSHSHWTREACDATDYAEDLGWEAC
ncbi:unnamed protein product [Clonostachys rosea f. rosea IK726]|jgi:hypothetical protein|uniref:Uncharacterized protein n=1 Tax=Clonostachys rosea f. rosea IK726 TaxID=1349383 RepID=A0ACA9U3F0_BIOOC|nr:unnamed protein product [Clonostachys rosea f. rosea IK726]